MKEKQLEHWECSNCKKELTYFDEQADDIAHKPIFEIRRANKSLSLEDDEIVIDDENEKMLFYYCEECFQKIVDECGIIRKTLTHKGKVLW